VSLTADIGCDLRKLSPEVGETRSSSRVYPVPVLSEAAVAPLIEVAPPPWWSRSPRMGPAKFQRIGSGVGASRVCCVCPKAR
jgi:hypothetical protein